MPMRKFAGFTLVEMLVAIAVLAILLAIAVPSFQTFLDNYRVKRATEAVGAFLVNSKSQAVKLNRDTGAVVQINGANWCIGMDDSPATPCDCMTANSCVVDGAERVLQGSTFRGVTLAGVTDGHTFTFTTQRGTATGNETLEFTSAEGRDYNVIVSSLGRVRICSPGSSHGGYPQC